MRLLVTFGSLATLALVLLVACNGEGASEPTPLANDTEPPAGVSTLEPDATATAVPPAIVPATQIQLPDGFTAYEIASGFEMPTTVALGPEGVLYVAERFGGVFQLRDDDDNGVFEERTRFLPASGNTGEFTEITGLVVADDDRVYVGDRGYVTILEDVDGDGVADEATPVISGLTVGRHQNDGLVFGPDGMLYVAHGSTCDDCVEADPLSASILRANADGTELEVYASGIRNSYDIAFDSEGRLWATDNGSDGDEAPFCATIDELNLIEQGADYGWPYAPECDPYASGTPPVASLGLHTAATGIDSYEGSQFPAEYAGDLFLTLWGSFVFEPEFAPELYRYTPGDTEIQPFSSGFDQPIDVLTDTDGSLLVLDYSLGALFRIVYSED